MGTQLTVFYSAMELRKPKQAVCDKRQCFRFWLLVFSYSGVCENRDVSVFVFGYQCFLIPVSVKIDTIDHTAKQISQKPFPLIVKVDA